ncbi:hypothetical protein H4R35_004681 [Dimargaris xerosporica]|nr:hypothetical protein H4R35_004681 [Dimargaris xerosporica]
MASPLVPTPSNHERLGDSTESGDFGVSFEFSAPRFRDFTQATPAAARPADSWFDKHQVTPYQRSVWKVSTTPNALSTFENETSAKSSPSLPGTPASPTTVYDDTVAATPPPLSAKSVRIKTHPRSVRFAPTPAASLAAADQGAATGSSSPAILRRTSKARRSTPYRPSFASSSLTASTLTFTDAHGDHLSPTLVVGDAEIGSPSTTPAMAPPNAFDFTFTAATPSAKVGFAAAPVMASAGPGSGNLELELDDSMLELKQPPKAATPLRLRPKLHSNPFDLTVPKPFRFHSATRTRRLLRAVENQTPKKPHPATKPRPNRAMAHVRRTARPANASSPFISLAERVRHFLNTPRHAKKARTQAAPVAKMTQPHSPNLQTKYRIKHPTRPVLTHAEQEWQKFLATPKYKARPLNKRILNQPDPLPSHPQSTLTVPQTPMFQPLAPRRRPMPDPSPPKVIKARPVPKFNPTAVPIQRSHQHTSPKPFNLRIDQLGERKRQKLYELIERKQAEETAARQFRAQPMPVDSPGLPPTATSTQVKLTQPVSPHFVTDDRGTLYQERLQRLVRQRQLALKKQTQFTAQPLPDFDHPFIPQQSTRGLTEIEAYELHTEKRQPERAQFDAYLRQREEAKEAVRRRQQEEADRQTAEEERRLRHAMVHRALPVPEFPTPAPPKKSQRPLTAAQSPYIGTKRKRKEIAQTMYQTTNMDAKTKPRRPIAQCRQPTNRH